MKAFDEDKKLPCEMVLLMHVQEIRWNLNFHHTPTKPNETKCCKYIKLYKKIYRKDLNVHDNFFKRNLQDFCCWKLLHLVETFV